MARQFREQLEEEVQLEEARKAQRAAAPSPVEPVAAAAAGASAAAHGSADPPAEGAGSAAAPHAANGGGSELTPEVSYAHHPQPGDPAQPTEHIQTAGSLTGDPTAGRPAQAGSADERRT